MSKQDTGEYGYMRGILTEADRRTLAGVSEIEPRSPSERRTRGRVRDRLTAALKDFTVLLEHLEPRDEEPVFDEVDELDAFAFLFRRHARGVITGERLSTGDYQQLLSMAVANGLERALDVETGKHAPQGRRYEFDVSVSIDIEQTEQPRKNVVEVEKGLQAGTQPFTGVQMLYEDGQLTDEEYRQLTRGEDLDEEPDAERRAELLAEPLPILAADDAPEGYMWVQITDEAVGTTELLVDDLMPQGYRAVFDEETRLALVLEPVGEELTDEFSHMEEVGREDFPDRPPYRWMRR